MIKIEKKRILYFDVLNVAACIAVIAMHHNGIVHTYTDSLTWKSALMVEVGAYWAVPVFLMLTGANLMTYREKYDTKTFFKKRLSRAVIPFFAWGGIVLVWKTLTGQYSWETFSVREVVSALFNYKMENIYWFFPFLFSVYLLMPIVSRLCDRKYRGTLWYAVGIMFFLQSTAVPLCKLFGIEWNGNFGLPMNSYVIFIFLGYLLATEDFSKRARHLLYAAGLFGAIFRYGAIYILSTLDGSKNTLFFNYGYFPSVLLACAVFVWAKSVDWPKVMAAAHIRERTVTKLAACSLGIYLIHRIVMYYELQLLGLAGITNWHILWRSAGILVTYLISLMLVSVIKKIPYLNKIMP